MAYYRCGPTAIGSRASWSVTTPESKPFERPLSGNYDRIFNAFERTNAFEYVRSTFEGKPEERHVGHGDVVVNRKMSSSFERADCALAAQTPCSDDEDFYREKILYSQTRQLFPLQEDLADWINKTIAGVCEDAWEESRLVEQNVRRSLNYRWLSGARQTLAEWTRRLPLEYTNIERQLTVKGMVAFKKKEYRIQII
ncbi:growth arrest-specific protein 2 [Danaus plexippus plexippus]|uniref:Growth arrest-specific protein 2 n=1 Tax=Danaus plexippus plexippus TaxID=278856 RepID=A0A212EQW2_DANPL|nr:growth arrest-specific protein 2 [Danaus plexippus plexippus]